MRNDIQIYHIGVDALACIVGVKIVNTDPLGLNVFDPAVGRRLEKLTGNQMQRLIEVGIFLLLGILRGIDQFLLADREGNRGSVNSAIGGMRGGTTAKEYQYQCRYQNA